MRGATVGGSGAVNGGYFCRGLPRDFDASTSRAGRWSDVLDSFRAIETDLDFDRPGPRRQRSHPGAPHARNDRYHRAISSLPRERAGFGWIADLNDAAHRAAFREWAPSRSTSSTVCGSGPGAGYLIPALSRPNLRLHAQTRAVRVRFAGTVAVGVDAIGPRGRDHLDRRPNRAVRRCH